MPETPLAARHAARGAILADDRGILLPRRFGDAEAEYRALREGAALVDLSFRVPVRVTGADRATFLQGMLTNDVASLRPGAGCAALLLTIQGRVTADVRVLALEDVLLLDVDARVRADFVAALERLLVADEVELGDPPDPVTLVGVEGPAAARVVAVDRPAYGHIATDLGGVPVRVQRASELRGPGFVVHAPAAEASAVWDALVAAGATPCGMEALEGRRIELGVPRVGLDMDGSTLALEVPVEDAISQTKGCYLGQEVIARGTARGHVNRRLMGLRLDGPEPPRGAPLVRDGKEVGHLTSVGRAFGAGGLAALGFVRREHWTPGTELGVRHGHAATIARVAELPLA